MPSSLQIGFKKKGHFRTGGDLAAAMEKQITPPLLSAGRLMVKAIQGETPVRTGYLRRSTDLSSPQRRGAVYLVHIEAGAPYARFVNRRGRSRGYFERGVRRGEARVRGELQDAGKGLPLSAIWVSG